MSSYVPYRSSSFCFCLLNLNFEYVYVQYYEKFNMMYLFFIIYTKLLYSTVRTVQYLEKNVFYGTVRNSTSNSWPFDDEYGTGFRL